MDQLTISAVNEDSVLDWSPDLTCGTKVLTNREHSVSDGQRPDRVGQEETGPDDRSINDHGDDFVLDAKPSPVPDRR